MLLGVGVLFGVIGIYRVQAFWCPYSWAFRGMLGLRQSLGKFRSAWPTLVRL